MAFDNGLVDVDYGLVNEGIIVSDDYFSIIMDGTIHLVNQSEPSDKIFTMMPVHDPDGAEV